jgi:hypothetical protein
VTWWAQRFLPWTTSATTTTLVLLITATWASLLTVTAASASVVDRDAAVAILRKDDGLVHDWFPLELVVFTESLWTMALLRFNVSLLLVS